MNLRDYQIDIIRRAREEMRKGRKRVLIVSPTGSGKTSIGGGIVKGAVDKGKRILWLAHRKELLDQVAQRFDSIGIDNYGIVQSGRRGKPYAQIQIASVQTVASREVYPEADLVVWDECHHCAASSYRTIQAKYSDKPQIGLTATPERSDGATLADAFDVIVAGPQVRELIALGHLVPCDVIAPTERNRFLSEDPLAAYKSLGGNRPVILFAKHVAHSQEQVAKWNAEGIKSAHVDGNTPPAERNKAIKMFASGELQMLSNVYVFTEGFDCTRAEVCLLARGSTHESIYIQMVGRVLRPHPGKKSALVIDLQGSVHEHGLPDQDRRYSLDGRAIDHDDLKLKQCASCGAVFPPKPKCPYCGFEASLPPDMPTIERRELVKVGPLRPEASDDEKQRTLTRLKSTAEANGYKPGWVAFRFKATYGHWPKMGAA